ncbi:MAG: metal ABC transporter permease [Chlamydiia bacterium]|nr:metal ABC transporter permease [Chlamydiia bacterium]
MNPYFGQDFFGFFKTFFTRLFTGFEGKLMTDELQLFVLLGISLACALSGTFLVLRKMSMLANSLSHTVLLGIVIAYVLIGGNPDSLYKNPWILMGAALFMGFLTVLITYFLTHVVKLQEDASIGMVFTSLFALGIIAATTMTRSAHIGQEAVMGNVDALHITDLKLVFWVLLFNALTIVLFYKELVLVSFDPTLAKTLGISVSFFSALLMAEASFAIIGSFRSTGVLMVLSFLVIPPLIARFYSYRLKHQLFIALGFGALASVLGVAIARHLLSTSGILVSTSGLIVVLLILLFVLSWAYKRIFVKS